MLALVGVVNIPIIYFLGQVVEHAAPGFVGQPDRSVDGTVMLWGMLLMALAFWMYSIAIALYRARSIMLERERGSEWVKGVLAEDSQ